MLFFACFLFTNIFSDVNLIFATHGILGIALLLMKTFSVVYFPLFILRGIGKKLYAALKNKMESSKERGGGESSE